MMRSPASSFFDFLPGARHCALAPAGALAAMAFAALCLPVSAAEQPAVSADDKTAKAEAQEPSVAQNDKILRVCAQADELPYSNREKAGFENKIAMAVAKNMGRDAAFVWLAKPGIYLVRDQLDVKLCDVVMGMDTGDTRVLTTKAYYRAPYVFIQRKDTKLDIKDWSSPDLAKASKIGFTPGSPAQVMLEKIGLFREHFNYMHSLTNFQDKRNKFTRVPPQRMVSEVANGTAEIAINFAPEVARYAKDAGNIVLTVIPDSNVRSDGEKVPHHFDQSIGVRKDDAALLASLDSALEKSRPEIEEILKSEGIPLLAGLPRS